MKATRIHEKGKCAEMRPQKGPSNKKKIHRTNTSSHTRLAKPKPKSSLNRRLRNELKRRNKTKSKATILDKFRNPRRRQTGPIQPRRPKPFKSKNAPLAKDRKTSLKKRNSRCGSRDRISCNAKDTLGRLRQMGFCADTLRLKRARTFFGGLRMNSTEPRKRKESHSRRRRKQTCTRSYRNQLFGNLKRSFNLRQAQSDHKRAETANLQSPIASPSNSGFLQLKARIDQIKKECRQFVKSKGKYGKGGRSQVEGNWGSERKAKEQSKLRVFKYKNATLVTDPRSGKSVSLFKTGEVFFGSVNQANQPHGRGIFFFPFCGFVFGNFEDNKIHGQGVFKEPNSSFGIGSFEHGIIGDFQVHFDLRPEASKSTPPANSEGTRPVWF